MSYRGRPAGSKNQPGHAAGGQRDGSGRKSGNLSAQGDKTRYMDPGKNSKVFYKEVLKLLIVHYSAPKCKETKCNRSLPYFLRVSLELIYTWLPILICILFQG